MKAELKFFMCVLNSDNLILLWGKKVSMKCKQFDIKYSAILKGYNFSYNNSTFVFPFYTFPWWEKYLFTRQVKVRIGKSTSVIVSVKGKMPSLAGSKHLSVHFFLHGLRLFYLSTEKVRVQSVRNGHQSGYSRADTIKNNINKIWKKFSIRVS